MAKRMTIMIIALVIFFGVIFGAYTVKSLIMKRVFANYQPPPVTISATQAKSTDWQPWLISVGTLTAVNGVDVSTEVAGIVKHINFRSGQVVKKDEPLIQLDDNIEKADLENNQAELKLMNLNYDRLVELYKTRATSKSSVDEAKAKLTQAQAQVDKTKAIIQQKNITAPFSGKIGIRQVNIGQYVQPGQNLVTLQSMDPMYVDFSLPEQDLNKLYVGEKIGIEIDTYPGEVFYGSITAVDAKVQEQTHNILVRASVPNKENRLYPGLFAYVRVLLPDKKNVVVIPQTAISYSLFGDSVYVVKQEGKDKEGKPILKVYREYITTGAERGNVVVVTQGLEPGTEVVTSGQLKLDNGTQVKINNSVNLNIPQVVQ